MKTVTKIDRDDSLEKITTIDAIVDDIIERAKEYMGKSNAKKHNVESEIRRAYHFAENAHRGQMRHSGEPYIIHPVEATKELLLLKPDLVTIQACLLHDVPEDTSKTIEDIEANF
jgi:GTP pyrophosphokinase